jgi:hypothetical protein
VGTGKSPEGPHKANRWVAGPDTAATQRQFDQMVKQLKCKGVFAQKQMHDFGFTVFL